MGPPGGGRTGVTARFTRHLSIVSIDSFDDNTMKKIFTSIVDWHFAKDFESDVLRWARVSLARKSNL
jgi:dynein heavy chain